MQSVITDTGSWVQGAYSLAMALVAGASLAVGVWVVARERGRRISLSLLAGSVAVAVYLLAFSFLVRSTERAAAERWAYVAYLGVPFIVPALYQFSMDLLGLWRQRRPWILTGWVVGFVYMALAQTSGLLIAGVMEVPPWGYYTDLTLWNTPFVAWSILLLWLALRDFWLEYRHAEPVQRARIRWLAIPLLVASVGFVDYGPSLGLDVPPLGFAFLAVFPVAAAWVVGRYHLPDLTPAFAAEQILATMAEPLLVVDGPGRVTVANPAVGRLLGWSPSEMEGAPLSALVGHETARRILDPSGLQDREMELEARTGWPVPVLVSTNELVVSERHVGTVIVARDIREQRSAARRLQRREEHYRALIENARDTITLLDAEGRIMYRSPSHAQVLGRDASHGLGSNVFDFVHPEDRQRLEQQFAALTTEPGGSMRDEVRIQHEDGVYRVLDLRAQNLLAHPAVQGVVVNGRDVTGERELEQKLRQAQKMEAIGRLAGGVAHDFNNILTAVQGNIALLREQATSGSELAVGLDEIRASVQRAGRLTSQLLSFSRRQVIQPRALDLNQMLQDLRSGFEQILGDGIRLVIEPGPDAGEIRADPGQIEQALIDLVVNARDAMDGEGRLEIATASVEVGRDPADPAIAAGSWVVVTITDDGEGMDEVTRQRIFEPFFTTKTQTEAAGLGLATAYGAVRQASGHIEVESEPGAGTRFSIYLPRLDRETEAVGPAPVEHREVRGAGQSVLVVEDEAPVRGLITKILERKGYRVMSAADGESAMDVVRSHDGAIDLLIADLVMPGLTGREVAERLGARYPDMATILISGYTADEVVRQGIREGEYVFLAKPFDPDTLTARVADVLDAGRAA